MKLIQKLEKKFGRFAIKNLTYYIMGAYIIGWLIQLSSPQVYDAYLSLNAEAILHGQIWRIITFLVNPPSSGMLFMIFALYLYYFIGTNIERAWGTFRFNLYYFTGVLFHVIAAIIIYLLFGINFDLGTYYLNMSLFLAFAALYPDMQLLLFFIIPVKIKWLALLDIILFTVTIAAGFIIGFLPSSMQSGLFYNLSRFGIIASLPTAIAALVSLLNFIIFYLNSRNLKKISPKEFKRRNDFKQKTRTDNSQPRHRCDVCGRTEMDGEDLVFRYCSKCNGTKEYCQDHLFTHEHKK